MIDAKQLREWVIKPACEILSMYDPRVEQLILGTFAVESHLGSKLKQYPTGPAKGIGQMEDATHDDCWREYLMYRPPLAAAVRSLASPCFYTSDPVLQVRAEALISGLLYSAGMTRIKYRRAKRDLPALDDWNGMASYWEEFYNTRGNAPDERDFMRALDVCKIRQVYGAK